MSHLPATMTLKQARKELPKLEALHEQGRPRKKSGRSIIEHVDLPAAISECKTLIERLEVA